MRVLLIFKDGGDSTYVEFLISCISRLRTALSYLIFYRGQTVKMLMEIPMAGTEIYWVWIHEWLP